MGAARHGDLAVCSGVCWFICGQLGVALAGCCSVVFVLANMVEQMRRNGGWCDLPLATGGLSCTLGYAASLLCVWLFFAVWPGVGDSGLSLKCTK